MDLYMPMIYPQRMSISQLMRMLDIKDEHINKLESNNNIFTIDIKDLFKNWENK